MNAWDKKLQEDRTKADIIRSVAKIVDQSNWSELSMRKIAKLSKHSVPVIYKYFPNKNILLNEFSRRGFLRLYREIITASAKTPEAEDQLVAMWEAYWNFALGNEKYYRLMFGVGTESCTISDDYLESRYYMEAFKSTIRNSIAKPGMSDDRVDILFYKCWSIIHGLIALKLEKKGCADVEDKLIVKKLYRV